MGMVSGLFHFVFGKRGARSGSARVSAPRAAAPPEPAAAPTPPAAPAPAPAPPQPAAPPPEPVAAPEPVVDAAPAPAPEPVVEPAPEPVVDAAPEPAPEPVVEPAPEPAPEPTPEPVVDVEPPAPPAPEPTEPPPAPAPNNQLTPHFTLSELTRSGDAQAAGIANIPSPEHLPNIQRTAECMEKVRSFLGNHPITVNSCYRNPEVNALVGGVPNSAHALGFAVDFTCKNFGDPYAITEAIQGNAALMAEVDQLIFEKGRWVHIAFGPGKRKEVLTAYEKSTTGKRTHYVKGLQKLDEHGRLPEG